MLVLSLQLALAAPGAAGAQEVPATPERILVHITHGPEHPTRAALGFAVAGAALEQGHEVTVFLAGDGVQLVREAVRRDLVGLGTGDLGESFEAVLSGGGELLLSGGSSAARGVTQRDLEGLPVEFAGPARLVELGLAHDRIFVY